MADFSEPSFPCKSLAVSTINGYRAAIGSVHLGWKGVSVCRSGDLTDLVKAFFISRPPVRSLVPPLSLTLVLSKILGRPF